MCLTRFLFVFLSLFLVGLCAHYQIESQLLIRIISLLYLDLGLLRLLLQLTELVGQLPDSLFRLFIGKIFAI